MRWSGSLVEALLGRKVAGSAHEHPGGGEAGDATGHQGEAEVGDLDQPAIIDQEIGGFDVAVDDALFVGRAEAGCRLQGDVGDLDRIEGPRRAQDLLQTAARDVLHGKEVATVLLADGVDLDNVRVVEAGRAPRLAQESLDVVRILGQMLAEDLDGDETVEGLLVRLVDDPHAAATELGNYSVMTDTVHHCMLLRADAEGAEVC